MRGARSHQLGYAQTSVIAKREQSCITKSRRISIARIEQRFDAEPSNCRLADRITKPQTARLALRGAFPPPHTAQAVLHERSGGDRRLAHDFVDRSERSDLACDRRRLLSTILQIIDPA